MKWIIRYGVHFWLQNQPDGSPVVNWGDRSTARLFCTKEQAQTVVDALLKTGWYRGCHMEVEEFRPDYVDVPPDLLWRLRRCAEILANPPQDQDLRTFWKFAGLQSANIAQDYLMGGGWAAGDAVEIPIDLLEDLRECALKLEIPPAPEVDQGAIADFAQKTLALVNDLQEVRDDA